MLEPEDLLSPSGILLLEMFPALSAAEVDNTLIAYVAEGYSKAAVSARTAAQQDDAARAWSYYRAFHRRYLEMSSAPTSTTLEGEGTASYATEQIRNFRQLAEHWLGEFTTLVDVGGSSEAPGASVSVPLTFVW